MFQMSCRLGALTAACALALAACGSGDGGSASGSSSTGDDAEASALAQEFIDSSGLPVEPAEAECAVDGMVDELGLVQLAALGDLGDAELPPEEVLDSLAGVMDDCFDEAAVNRLLTDEFSSRTGDEELVACLVGELEDEITVGDLLTIGAYASADPDHPELESFQTVVAAAVAACE